MISIKYVLDRIRDVKFTDYLSVFPMVSALLLRPFFRKKYKDAWLVCEEPAEARDNGYHFFKYLREKQPQQKCFYAIKRRSVDYHKVAELGETIEYGSVQHWLAYFLTKYNISSQKGGKPNAAMCAFMEMNGKFKPQNVFLQHGVTINNVRWLYADRSRIQYFITSTRPETEYIVENFGYPEESILLTGMPRFDGLHHSESGDNLILIMPTWRYWFNLKSKQTEDTDSDFKTSKYVQKWAELLSSERITQIANDKTEVVFYLHRNLQRFTPLFENLDTKVRIASWTKYDIQDLLKRAKLLVTDYSSVFFDMIYMKKPIIFYQFDKEEYRAHQYSEGYFDYGSNVFGNCHEELDDLLDEMETIVGSNFQVSDDFIAEHKRIFKYYDAQNSERLYRVLIGKELEYASGD